MGLFHSKKKSAPIPELQLLDSQGREILKTRIDLFPFQEPVIIAASETFFNDPEPCEIHRRALQLRLSGEIQKAIPEGRIVEAKDLPEEIAGYLKGYEFASVCVKAEENN